MAREGELIPEPEVFLYVKPTEVNDNMIKDFLKKCLELNEEAFPGINEQKEMTHTGLVHQYDAQQLNKMLPGTDLYRTLEDRLRGIARSERCNIICWISENKYCETNHATFKTSIKAMLEKNFNTNKGISRNDLPTVVILTACNSSRVAYEMNQIKHLFPESPTITNSQKPKFLGFNGQVHPYKSDIFICENFLDFKSDESPTRICATTRNNTNIRNSRSIGPNTNITPIITRSEANSSERLKCCKAMIEEYPRHFVEAFKGQRNCIKLDWAKFTLRIRNIKGKILGTTEEGGNITEADSMIRGSLTSPPQGYTPDGILCKPTNDNANPCGIENNLVNENTRRRANSYSSRISASKKKWGKLLEHLYYGGDANGYVELFNNLSLEEKRDFINKKDSYGNTLLMYVLSNNLMSGRLEKIRELLNLGANVNIVGGNQTSVAVSLLEAGGEDSAEIKKYILFNTEIDIPTQIARYIHPYLGERGQERLGKAFKTLMDQYMKDLKDITKRGTIEQKQRAKQVFQAVSEEVGGNGYLLTMIIGYPNYQGPATSRRTIESDYRILQRLRERIPLQNGSSITRYDKIKSAMEAIRETGTQNIYPVAAAPAAEAAAPAEAAAANREAPMGGRRKRTSRTKKNRRNKRRQTRRR